MSEFTKILNEQFGLNVVQNGRHWNRIRHLLGRDVTDSGHVLREITFKFKEDEVFIMVKKDSPKGPQIAFLDGGDVDKALWNLGRSIATKSLKWRPDKWRSMRSDYRDKR